MAEFSPTRPREMCSKHRRPVHGMKATSPTTHLNLVDLHDVYRWQIRNESLPYFFISVLNQGDKCSVPQWHNLKGSRFGAAIRLERRKLVNLRKVDSVICDEKLQATHVNVLPLSKEIGEGPRAP